MKLKNKTALITGGSRGIGCVVAEFFLKEGASVSIAARSATELSATRDALLKNFGQERVMATITDVSEASQVKKLVSDTVKKFGALDVLVNVAGIQPPIGEFIDMDDKEWTKNVAVNLFGTMFACKYVLHEMVANGKGKIINFSGGGATEPRPFFSAYAASKAAVVRFTETLAEEVKKHGIDVNAVAPGAVNTKMLDEIVESGQAAGAEEFESAQNRKEKGGASPQKAAELCVFLASKASDGITGKLISAVWDDWKNFETDKKLKQTPLFTLRRIDGKNFVEVGN